MTPGLFLLLSALLASGPAPRAAAPSHAGVTLDRWAVDPAVSPDGRQIAISILGKIFLLPISGGSAKQLSFNAGWDAHPAWSPDGETLIWARALPNGASAILSYDFERGSERVAHNVTTTLLQVGFDPKTDLIYYVQERTSEEAHVFQLPGAGRRGVRMTDTSAPDERSFAFSPTGDRMLVESGRYGATDLYLLSLEHPGAQRVATTSARELQVAWGRHGWVYLSRENGVDRLVAQTEEGEGRTLFSAAYSPKSFGLTPDGATVVLSAGGKLSRIDVATGAATPIAFSAQLDVPARAPADLIITGARVFTGRGDSYVENATVVVRNGRIESVTGGGSGATPSGSSTATAGASASTLPAGIPTIDAHGRVLMAGLVDNHWHYGSAHFLSGPLLLGRGITSVRDPGADLGTSLAFREAIRLAILDGPNLYTTGPLIDGPSGYHPELDVELRTPEAANALVGALADQGVDALKVYFMLEPAVLKAVVDAAHARGLKVTGHLGVRTSWGDALGAGIDGLNHLRVFQDLLATDARANGDDGSLDSERAALERMQADWSLVDPDSPAASELIQRMASQGVALDPTLNIQQTSAALRRTLTPAQLETVGGSFRKMSRFVLRAFQAGVSILAGTDNGSIYDELETYADAGIPLADVLRTATLNGAAWLGKTDEFGTVEPGRRADLILVDGDPLADIRSLRRVQTVIKDGRVVVSRER